MMGRVAFVLVMILALVGCQAIEKQYSEGNAKRLSGKDVVSLLAGNTVLGTDLVIYYGKDGRKVIRDLSGTKVLKWWLDDNKNYCETLDDKGTELCGIFFNVLEQGVDKYRVFGADGRRVDDVTIVKGNAKGL
jgi:hypothetical protein